MGRFSTLDSTGIFLAFLFALGFTNLALGTQEVIVTLSATGEPVMAGGRAAFWINALNPGLKPAAFSFPEKVVCRPVATDTAPELTALPGIEGSGATRIDPGAFIRRLYTFSVPSTWSGVTSVELQGFPSTRLAFSVQSRPSALPASVTRWPLVFLSGARLSNRTNLWEPGDFFKEHISGYEPLYFIAGTKSPNARFQISFKYQLFNERGWPAEQACWLTGLQVAYTQTSLWDWNAPSAPFHDTSYKPELLYSWERALGGEATDLWQLDLQGGCQHESNGKAGGDSRSLNIAYLRPALSFGSNNGWQLTLKPRVSAYLGDLSDNPDIADYRGYVELRTVMGWKRGLQGSALLRTGKKGQHAGVLADISYPLMAPPAKSFSVYLCAQYFTGYGESLLDYRQKSDVFRAGFSLYR